MNGNLGLNKAKVNPDRAYLFIYGQRHIMPNMSNKYNDFGISSCHNIYFKIFPFKYIKN